MIRYKNTININIKHIRIRFTEYFIPFSMNIVNLIDFPKLLKRLKMVIVLALIGVVSVFMTSICCKNNIFSHNILPTIL